MLQCELLSLHMWQLYSQRHQGCLKLHTAGVMSSHCPIFLHRLRSPTPLSVQYCGPWKTSVELYPQIHTEPELCLFFHAILVIQVHFCVCSDYTIYVFLVPWVNPKEVLFIYSPIYNKVSDKYQVSRKTFIKKQVYCRTGKGSQDPTCLSKHNFYACF